jgi:hypothetical protein
MTEQASYFDLDQPKHSGTLQGEVSEWVVRLLRSENSDHSTEPELRSTLFMLLHQLESVKLPNELEQSLVTLLRILAGKLEVQAIPVVSSEEFNTAGVTEEMPLASSEQTPLQANRLFFEFGKKYSVLTIGKVRITELSTTQLSLLRWVFLKFPDGAQIDRRQLWSVISDKTLGPSGLYQARDIFVYVQQELLRQKNVTLTTYFDVITYLFSVCNKQVSTEEEVFSLNVSNNFSDSQGPTIESSWQDQLILEHIHTYRDHVTFNIVGCDRKIALSPLMYEIVVILINKDSEQPGKWISASEIAQSLQSKSGEADELIEIRRQPIKGISNSYTRFVKGCGATFWDLGIPGSGVVQMLRDENAGRNQEPKFRINPRLQVQLRQSQSRQQSE